MTDNFKILLDTLVAEGFPQLTEKTAAQGKALDYKITPYSLNTKLSFKFESLDHFLAFLKLHDSSELEKKKTVLQTTLMELDLNPAEFFWVNFFEKVDEEI
jgi:hypothetical protein